MPEAAPAAGSRILATIKKRWRGWLRALHRDFGYLAVGFTIIYAVSGLAINHISDWDPNFTASERTLTITPIAPDLPDADAVQRVLAATGTGTPDDVYRAGDELRLSYAGGSQVTVIGDTVTVQERKPRFFLRIANWLHYNRGKQAWTYMADLYAVMLLYLAISGIFMIKGKLGLRWRGTILISLGIAVPLTYVALSGGPSKASGSAKVASPSAARPARDVRDVPAADVPAADVPAADVPAAGPDTPQVGSASPDDGFAMKPRPPKAAPAASTGSAAP